MTANSAHPQPDEQPAPPCCQHLCWKSQGYRTAPEPDQDRPFGLASDGNHYWCIRTLAPLGPDAEPVGQTECNQDRPCYEPESETRT